MPIGAKTELSFGRELSILGAVRDRREYLGIEGGGTRTVAVVCDADGNFLRRREFASGNVRLLSDAELASRFSEIAAFCPEPMAVGAGMAGARDEKDRARIWKAITAAWGSVAGAVTHDLEIALAAGSEPDATGSVLVLSGTGSCCFGQSGSRTAKVGGWGHLLGDRGSGYDLAIGALKDLVYEYDRHGKFGPLGQCVLKALALNDPNDLIGWIQNAAKAEVAALAPQVFEAATDPIAKRVVRQAAESLARDAGICASRLSGRKGDLTFVLAGSVLLKQPPFANTVRRLIRQDRPGARVVLLPREAAWGAIELARRAVPVETKKYRPGRAVPRIEAAGAPDYYPEFDPASSPTEQRNPASKRFHELPTTKMFEIMLQAEQGIVPALREERASIVKAIDLAGRTLKKGGRIFYVGAGTSGRLGVLDASECPPTFRTPPEMIQGIIAGGQRALWQAVEGAEDDTGGGASALRFRGLTPSDLVIGIAASGRTPFVWGALDQARTVGAKTILLCFNPSLKIAPAHRPDVLIAPNLGPEILTGSTRLKCGTATKLVLNMISTIAMVRIGKVMGNLMVDLNPSNMKLRDRAIRIVQELAGGSTEEAKAALEKSGWVVKDAWKRLKGRSR